MIKGVAFDFNGVIVDDERLHFESMRKTCEPYGVELTEKKYWEKYLALDDENAFREIISDNQDKLRESDLRSLVAKKISGYMELLNEGASALFFPKAVEVIKKLSETFRLGIVSGARRIEIEKMLALGEIEDLFEFIISAGETKRGKPYPDQYEKAVELFRLKPSEVAAVEDSIGGIQAAKATGLFAIAVEHSYDKSYLKKADRVISSISDLTVETING